MNKIIQLLVHGIHCLSNLHPHNKSIEYIEYSTLDYIWHVALSKGFQTTTNALSEELPLAPELLWLFNRNSVTMHLVNEINQYI
jgi:hypothetical protein